MKGVCCHKPTPSRGWGYEKLREAFCLLGCSSKLFVDQEEGPVQIHILWLAQRHTADSSEPEEHMPILKRR